MSRLLPLCFVIGAVLTAAPAAAQPPLTEADAVARLSLESPLARALGAEVELVRAESLAAGRVPNPRLTFTRESVAGVTEGFLLASQVLPVTGYRGLQVQSAAQRVRASELRAEDLLRRLRGDVRRAFIELSALEARERELDAALTSLQVLADVLARREQAGDAAGFDRLRAEREAQEVAAMQGEARAQRARAQGVLASYFFPPPDPSTLHAAPLSTDRLPLPPANDLVAQAQSRRPDLQAMERDIEAARVAGAAASRGRVPEPEVAGGLKTSSVGDDRRGWVLSLLASVPLFDRAQPERAQAAARENLAAARRDALRAEVASTVLGLRLAAEERRRTADEYRREAVSRSDQLRRIAQVGYDAGERGILELLDAYRSAADARLRLVELDAAAAHSEIDLALATAVEIRK